MQISSDAMTSRIDDPESENRRAGSPPDGSPGWWLAVS